MLTTYLLEEWLRTHQHRDPHRFDRFSGGWSGFSGSIPFQMGLSNHGYRDVTTALRETTIKGRLPQIAPVGAIHFFRVNGHDMGDLVVDFDGGGTRCLGVCSPYDMDQVGNGLKFSSVQERIEIKHQEYLGWSDWYGVR